MKYTVKYFYENFPEWKRKKDSVLVRYFFRPISFVFASLFASLGFTANGVSMFSTFVAFLASAMFVIPNHICHIVGACLVAVWMILDCVDGNIARSVKKQAFGEFVDSCSSYCLIASLFICVGIAAYNSGGVLFSVGDATIVIIGALASIADPLSRLLYQKYLSCAKTYENDTNTAQTEKGKLRKLQDRIDKEIGLNGIFIPGIIVCALFNWLDIFAIVYCCYYVGELLVSLLYFNYKTIKYNKSHQVEENK